MRALDRVERRVLIVAGEASGDLHGANLIRAAREIDPGLCFFGIAGRYMREAGCRVLVPAEELAVMGLVEVVERFPAIRRAFRAAQRALHEAPRPDLVVLIDYPGFNLRLARQARRAGVPVLYYISPKVWAWKRGRVKTIARDVDHLAVIFPFEPELYRGLDLTVSYVGNPLLDEFRMTRGPAEFLAACGLDPAVPTVGLFPGSRRSEIRYCLATLLATAERLHRARPELQFLVPLAPSLDRDLLAAPIAKSGLPITLVEENIYDLAGACGAVLCVSGTVTLQVALAGTPLAILYRGAALTVALGRRLVKIPYFGLPNIVAGRQVSREFLQEAANPEALAAEILRLLDDGDYRRRAQAGLAEVRERLGAPGCSQRVARIASAMARGNAAGKGQT